MNTVDKKIGSIKFSCVSPEEIRKMSAVKIITADTYDDEGYPIVGGLMDSRMGVIEPGIRCKTCNGKVDDCPGHFGHIELAMPVIHVGFIKDIKDMLDATCSKCGKLLLSDAEVAERLARMDEITRLGGDTIDIKNYVKETVKIASARCVCPDPNCGSNVPYDLKDILNGTCSCCGRLLMAPETVSIRLAEATRLADEKGSELELKQYRDETARMGGSVGKCYNPDCKSNAKVPEDVTNDVYNLLNGTCSCCGRLLLDEGEIAAFGEKKAEAGDNVAECNAELFKAAASTKVCPYCNSDSKEMYKVRLEQTSTFVRASDGSRMTEEEIQQRFDMITDDDLSVMGIAIPRLNDLLTTIRSHEDLYKVRLEGVGKFLMETTGEELSRGELNRRLEAIPAEHCRALGLDPSNKTALLDQLNNCEEVYKVKLDKPTTFRKANTNIKLTPKEVRERLELIPDDHIKVLGLDPAVCRPEWMVLTTLAVPPVTVRPSITLESSDRSEDDLTHKLVDVLRINQRLRENRDGGAPQLIVEDLWELLQYHVTTYFDNQTSGIPPARHRSGRPLKTLVQRLKGKEGRFRSNLSGKRVNFSARTVISPDPNLSINDVGVPVRAARELTVSMKVNEHNLEDMKLFVKRGPVAFARFLKKDENGKIIDYDLEGARAYLATNPTSDDLDYDYLAGVNYIIRDDGRRIKVKMDMADTVLENLNVGYTIERQLVNGDVVLFNRQPSLHRMSIMAHRVRIMHGRTFRFNLTDCAPYNADFDGDEMNLHVLQSDEARAEARIIMQVQENILSPRYGGPIIGGIHDHISGSYFLTHGIYHPETNTIEEQRFGRYEAMNIIYKLSDFGAVDKSKEYFEELKKDTEEVRQIPEPRIDENGKPYWTGKDLFSLALPTDFNITFRANVCNCKEGEGCKGPSGVCPTDGFVKIRNGKLLSGTIDKNGIGNSDGKILEKIARDYGSARAAKFLYDVTRLALGAVMNHGFSTGIGDEDIPSEDVKQIRQFSSECVDEVSNLVESYREGTLAPSSGNTVKETLEKNAAKKLGEARSEAGKIAGKSLGMTNPAVIMAKTGARGNMNNLSQMAGCVGQQNVRGSRIARGYLGRTTSHFEKGDLGAYARGFCLNSYKSGLTPTEFFFHAMGGREGLVDTAVRTARSGYMQRRLVSALEDLKMTNDGSIRNTVGTIIQFKYGEDGIDPSKAVRGKSVELNDLFTEVLGEDAELLINVDQKESRGGDYGTREKDLETVEPEDDYEGDEDSLGDTDDNSDYEGGE